MIFGNDGLINADESICFDAKSDDIEDASRELSGKFHRYFQNKLKSNLKEKVNKPLCTGLVENAWTNNNSESLNHILKQAINWKSKPLLDLVNILTTLIEAQFKDIRKAIVGTGQFRLAKTYEHFGVTRTVWVSKTTEERDRHYKRLRQFIPKDKMTVTSTDGKMTVVQPRSLGKKIGQHKRKINERTKTFKKTKTKELQHEVKEEARSDSKRRRGLNRNRVMANKYDENINYMGRKKTGAKQARRCENLKYLLNLNEKDDGCEMETDLFEPSVTHFSELFMEQEKMKIWNDFINSSEDEQNQILKKAERKMSRRNDENGNKEEVTDADEDWEEIIDKRSSHPAYTAEEAFRKIDKNIKSFLKRRHVPMGVIESLEKELVSFFTEWPSSVYLSDLKSSFERMMLHALCQYLDLVSSSYDDEGNRRTQVENKQPYFSPPTTLLTQYLAELRL